MEVGIVAIQAGADAVYMGAPEFGARQAAGNSLEDITQLVKYAHRFGVQVLVTLNTLLNEDEYPRACALAHELYKVGVDALIIQDLHLLSDCMLLRNVTTAQVSRCFDCSKWVSVVPSLPANYLSER